MTSVRCRWTENYLCGVKLKDYTWISINIDADMTNVNISRMFRGKMRSNTCRIILLTSLVWLVVDVVLLMRYADFFNNVDKRSGEYDVEVSHLTFFFFVLLFILAHLTWKVGHVCFALFEWKLISIWKSLFVQIYEKALMIVTVIYLLIHSKINTRKKKNITNIQ